MSNMELAVMIGAIIMFTTVAFWVENRYAKLLDTQEKLGQQQTEIRSLQMQLLQLINSLPEQQRKEFVERISYGQIIDPHKTVALPK